MEIDCLQILSRVFRFPLLFGGKCWLEENLYNFFVTNLTMRKK